MSPGDKDQLLAEIRDGLPRVWWGIYVGAKDVGFNEAQAFALLQTWIISQNPAGIRPSKDPPSD